MFVFKNFMEDLVKEKVEEYLKQHPEICQCERCKYDIMALVLNSFPPKYIVTLKGESYSRLNALSSQFKIDLLTAIIQAVDVVKKFPRHKNNEGDK